MVTVIRVAAETQTKQNPTNTRIIPNPSGPAGQSPAGSRSEAASTTHAVQSLRSSIPALTGPVDASVYPFSRNDTWQRIPAKFDSIPKGDALFRDGKVCAIGCKPKDVIDGWPLRPFHKQHPLRAGLNELRESSLHHGVDIQARDGSRVYAMQPGYAHILQSTGPESRIQVSNYIYWHVIPNVSERQYINPYKTVLGKTKRGFGHLHLSEVSSDGSYLNPLRPHGRALTPWHDRYSPILGALRLGNDGGSISIFDPQSFTKATTYKTPVIAPAFVAYRLWDKKGKAVSRLTYILRGSHNLPWSTKNVIYAQRAHKVSFSCYDRHKICKPHWEYRVSNATTRPRGETLRITIYAWDWAGNASARDVWVRSLGQTFVKVRGHRAKKLENKFLGTHYTPVLRKHLRP